MGEFETLLESSFDDPEMQKLIKEREAATEAPPLSVGELVKGYPGPQDELDLHGKTGPEAMTALKYFVENSRHRRLRTLRVVTGKGLHSPHMKSVLPELTEQKLAEMRRQKLLLAFRKEKGGGSFLLYLVS